MANNTDKATRTLIAAVSFLIVLVVAQAIERAWTEANFVAVCGCTEAEN